jgi:hypothetical protein
MKYGVLVVGPEDLALQHEGTGTCEVTLNMLKTSIADIQIASGIVYVDYEHNVSVLKCRGYVCPGS